MKKAIIFISLLVSVMVLDSCRKKDNPLLPEGMERVPTPKLTKDPTSPGTIVVSDLANFNGKVVVDLYFKNDIPPQKFDLVVIKNGNKNIVKHVKNDITTFPTTVSFTGQQLATLFGEPVKTCDFFDFGVNITANGKLYEAFPLIGNAFASGVAAQPESATTVRYSTKVEFIASDYTGNFTVVSDEFGDFTPGTSVMLTAINATQFSFKSPQVSNALPIIVTVDPATLAATITKQKIGDFFLWYPPYTNPNVAALGTNSSVSPCTKTLTLTLKYSVDQGAFDPYVLILQKP